jgi:hypothetical protein
MTSATINRNPRLAAARLELADAAILVQGLGHRLTANGAYNEGAQARKAARVLANIVRDLGNGFATPEISAHFDYVP